MTSFTSEASAVAHAISEPSRNGSETSSANPPLYLVNLSYIWDANKNKTSEGFGGTMSGNKRVAAYLAESGTIHTASVGHSCDSWTKVLITIYRNDIVDADLQGEAFVFLRQRRYST